MNTAVVLVTPCNAGELSRVFLTIFKIKFNRTPDFPKMATSHYFLLHSLLNQACGILNINEGKVFRPSNAENWFAARSVFAIIYLYVHVIELCFPQTDTTLKHNCDTLSHS